MNSIDDSARAFPPPGARAAMWPHHPTMSTTWSTWMRATMTTLDDRALRMLAALYQEVAGARRFQAQPFFEAALAAPAPRTARRTQLHGGVAKLQKRRSIDAGLQPLERAERGVFLDAGRTLLASPGTPGSAVTRSFNPMSWRRATAGELHAHSFPSRPRLARPDGTFQLTWSRAMGTGDSAQSSSAKPWWIRGTCRSPTAHRSISGSSTTWRWCIRFHSQESGGLLGRCWRLGVTPLFTARAERRWQSALAPAAPRIRNPSQE